MNAKHRIKRLSCLLLALLLLCAMIPACLAGEASQNWEATILFTHDLHSHFLPQDTAEGGQSGGYARLKTAIDREKARHPNALLLDGGDFSIGSLIQTLYVDEGAELRTMGALGYDAAALGNHEFDHKGTGFAQMLRSAVTSGDPLPALVCANYKPADSNPNKLDIQRAMAAYGMADYTLLERGGITYGIFGIFGKDADDCAPTSGFTLTDAAQAAQRCVDALKEQGAQVIICLSHSGTSEKQKESEDEQLAKNVSGIDVIVSGHTHSTTLEPIQVNDTLIVSCGEYTQNLGVLTVSRGAGGKVELEEYALLPVDGSVRDDPEMTALAETFQTKVNGTYLADYGLDYDQVLADAAEDFTLEETGNLIGDAYIAAIQRLEGADYVPVDFAVAPSGVIRDCLRKGQVTTSQAFDILSLGSGADGTPAYPLVSVYLTGEDLKNAFEVDASISALMPAATLYGAGMRWTWNPHRMILDKVTDAAQLLPEGGEAAIQDDRLYRVVADLYSGQMLGAVEAQSMGLLTVTPRDENGEPVTDLESRIVKNAGGTELKAWYALASYLEEQGTVTPPESRKTEAASWNPAALLADPGAPTLLVLGVLLLLAVLAVFIVRCVRRRRKQGSDRKHHRAQ